MMSVPIEAESSLHTSGEPFTVSGDMRHLHLMEYHGLRNYRPACMIQRGSLIISASTVNFSESCVEKRPNADV